MVSAYPLLLFGGQLGVRVAEGLVVIDGRFRFKCPSRQVVQFRSIRAHLDALLQRKITDPMLDISKEGSGIMEVVVELLRSERPKSRTVANSNIMGGQGGLARMPQPPPVPVSWSEEDIGVERGKTTSTEVRQPGVGSATRVAFRTGGPVLLRRKQATPVGGGSGSGHVGRGGVASAREGLVDGSEPKPQGGRGGRGGAEDRGRGGTARRGAAAVQVVTV